MLIWQNYVIGCAGVLVKAKVDKLSADAFGALGSISGVDENEISLRWPPLSLVKYLGLLC
jgi:hypothetical protein